MSNSRTQSACKHCQLEIYFSDFYKSWLHKKVVAETLHVAEPVAEPASTGEQPCECGERNCICRYLDRAARPFGAAQTRT